MKKTLLVLSALLMSFGAFAQDVTLDFTTNGWGLPEGKSNAGTTATEYTNGTYTITLAAADAFYFNTEGYLMLGKSGSTLTLPKFESDVEKIEVVGRTGASSSTKQNIYVGETAVSTETTGSTSTQTYEIAEDYQAAGNQYVFTVTSKHNAQITAINIYYKSATSLKAAGLTWSETKVSVEQGTEFTAPTFTNETTADVTFASDNTEVATVDAEGNITLAGALGTAVITASSEANEEYNAGEAQVTIEVFKYNTYKKATELVEGKEYLLVAQRDDATYYAYPVAESKTFGYLSTGKVAELTDEVKVKSSYNDAFTFKASGTGYTMQDYLGRYYYQNGTYNTFTVSEEAPTTAWSIEAQEDGTFKFTMNGMYVQFGDGTYTSFGVYDTAQENAVLPYLYELAQEQPEEENDTVIIKKDFEPAGAGFTLTTPIDWDNQYLYVSVNVSSKRTQDILSVGAEGESANWNKAIHTYLTNATSGGQTVWAFGGNRSDDTSFNSGEMTIELSKANGYVVNGTQRIAPENLSSIFNLSTIELSDQEANGTQTSTSTYHVIALYPVDKTATGITALQPATKSENNATYNLAGQRVGKDYKGIVIVNGKKVIRK